MAYPEGLQQMTSRQAHKYLRGAGWRLVGSDTWGCIVTHLWRPPREGYVYPLGWSLALDGGQVVSCLPTKEAVACESANNKETLCPTNYTS